MSRPRGIRRFWWNRLRPFWLGIRWPLIAVLAATALVLGWFGFGPALGRDASFWDRAYRSLQLFALEGGAVEPPVPRFLEVARVLAPIVTFYAAVSAILAIFRDQIARARVRWRARGHVIVCGLGRTGHALAHGFHEAGHRVVAIEIAPDAGAIEEFRQAGVPVLAGDATDSTLLAAARVDRARYLFAVCRDDGDNATIAVLARELVDECSGAALGCFVRVLDPDLAELLEAEMAARTGGGMRVEAFNAAERGAPALLEEYRPFDPGGMTPFGPPHLLVVGMGEMGSRVVLHAVRHWLSTPDGHTPLRISVADRDADRRVENFLLRYPYLEDACEMIPHVVDVTSPRFERGDLLTDAERGRLPLTSVYVCLGDDALGLGAALRLRRALGERRIPIVVRTKASGGLGALLGDDGTGYENLHVFGLLDLVCRPDVALTGRTEKLARAIHEEYVRVQREEGHTRVENPSMAPWQELPEHLRESNRRQADGIGAKLRAVGCEIWPLVDREPDSLVFTPRELERLARMEHDRWWRERECDGWTYAPEKNVQAKKSPYLVPWEELSEEIREYDRVAVRGIPAFLARAGFRAVRISEEDRDGEVG